MKKLMFIVSASLIFGFASTALAQGFVPLAAIPGLTDIQPTTGGLATFFNNLYKYLIGIAAALAVIQIVWAGLDIAFFHKDAVSTIADDKGKIYNAIFGLVLVLSPVLVFSIINPSILNLTLNLPPLDTKASAPLQTTVAPTSVNGFSTSGTLTGTPGLGQLPGTTPSGLCANIQQNTDTPIQPNQESCCAALSGCSVTKTATAELCSCSSSNTVVPGL